MTVREQAIEAIRKAPEDLVIVVLQLLEVLEQRRDCERNATALASEQVLAREWDTPEEDAAWQDL